MQLVWLNLELYNINSAITHFTNDLINNNIIAQVDQFSYVMIIQLDH